jgi:hypothetical protein
MVRIASFIAMAAAFIGAVNASVIPQAEQSDVKLASRLVYSPEITYPTANAEWTAGKKAKVTWKTDGLPESLQDATGVVRLGHITKGEEGEHLADVLAMGFKLADGEVSFKVPRHLQERHDYIVVLMGDSGNASPKFTIHAQ